MTFACQHSYNNVASATTYLSSAYGARIDVSDRCDDDLGDAADSQAGHEEYSPTSNLGDHAAVDDDREYTDGSQDAAIHERASHVRHLSLAVRNNLRNLIIY